VSPCCLNTVASYLDDTPTARQSGVTTFQQFQETWKCQGIRLRLGKSQEKGPESERPGNLCSWGNLIVTARQSNLPILYSYCNSFFIRDVHGEFGLINVHLFDLLPAISSRKVGDFFSVWRVVTVNSQLADKI